MSEREALCEFRHIRFGFVPKIGPAQRFKRPCAVSGKVKWLNESDALMMVEKLGGTGSAYLCEHCGSWHLTRQKGRRG